MEKRIPGSMRTRETHFELIEGRLQKVRTGQSAPPRNQKQS